MDRANNILETLEVLTLYNTVDSCDVKATKS